MPPRLLRVYNAFMARTDIKASLGQRDNGYRYNQDSFLLADFFRPRAAGMVADFCAGTGVVSILVLLEGKAHSAVALEINPSLAALACKNARDSGLGRLHVVAGDVMEAPALFRGRPFSAIVSNPPYRKLGSGRLNPDREKAIARHEIMMDLEGLVSSASLTLAPGGSLSLIMIIERLEEYRRILSKHGFSEARIRDIRHREDSPPKLFMSEAVLGSSVELAKAPPLILADEEGWSDEYMKVMEKYAG